MTTEQVFPENFPQSTFILEGVTLLNNSSNLKQEKTISTHQ